MPSAPRPVAITSDHLNPSSTVCERLRAFVALTKPRLAFFSVCSGVSGLLVARPEANLILPATLGIALAAGGALSFNQWWEREPDALMRRTADRPLPAGRLPAGTALGFSLALSLAGCGLLALTTTPLAAAIAALIIVIYGLVYTPMKRHTRWATEIGAVSGALPPLLGAAAAGAPQHPAAWALAAALLFWQMPHFFAVGWMYREDYRRAGFRLLPVIDSDGRATAWWSASYAGMMGIAVLIPWAQGTVGPIYGAVGALSAAALLRTADIMLRQQNDGRNRAARRLFLVTIATLPLMMIALVAETLF